MKHEHEIGDRIGAIISANDEGVLLIGYGTYQGDEIPPKNVGGFNFGNPNPKLVMDDGTVVWGCECWWGSEDRVKEMVGDRKVVKVDMDEYRHE